MNLTPKNKSRFAATIKPAQLVFETDDHFLLVTGANVEAYNWLTVTGSEQRWSWIGWTAIVPHENLQELFDGAIVAGFEVQITTMKRAGHRAEVHPQVGPGPPAKAFKSSCLAALSLKVSRQKLRDF